ncbi:MAG: Fe-S cluster assembly protein SufD [Methyloceanibacter sp.]|uniref:Fe-S cluster assembly protein SufD n=1 Tax=Methyloceanibacter sp. TaxID=1965321 RepID=UPI003D6D73FA
MDLSVQQFRTKSEQELLDLYAKAEKALPGAANPFVAELRAKAIKAYAHLGLPHRRIEAWKYTDLRARLTEVPPLIGALGATVGEEELGTALGKPLAEFPAYRLVLAEGELRVDLSDMAGLRAAGVEVASLAHVLEMPPEWLKQALDQANPREDDAVLALNTALMTGGVTLRLGEGVTLDKPIHLIHLDGTGEAATMVTRNVIVAEKGASATVLESFGSLGLKGLQRNAVTETLVGDKAAIAHIKFQREGSETLHLGVWLAKIGADARYQAFQLSTGAALARNQIYARFMGEHASADISGAVLLRARQHCDTTILVEHLVPHCRTRELLKAVVDEEARGVFQGKIVVAPGAQKTDSKQMAQALLLSETAEFDSKPELEIFADDVVCGHGATSGQIDHDLLFYLESRGLPEAQARALLIQAFVGEAFEQIDNEALRDAFAASAADWLGVQFED